MTTRIYHLAEAFIGMHNKEGSSQERGQCREFFDSATKEEKKEARKWAKILEEEHQMEIEWEARVS